MNVYKTPLFHPWLALLALVVPLEWASAQSAPSQAPRPKTQTEARRADDEATFERLNSRIDRLQSLIQQQRLMIEGMQKRLDEMNRSARATPDSSLMPVANAGPSPEDQMASVAESKPPNDEPKPAALAGWDRDKGRAFVRSADGAFETEIGGYGQLDYHGYASGNHPPNSFSLRRARIALEGKVERYFDFRIEGDFSDPVTPLRDLYVNVHRVEGFQLRFGQFRVPISQEEMRSDNFQDFVERSLVNNLVPSRSPGLGVSGVIKEGVFEYQIGAWNGKGLLAANNNGTPETAIRLRFNPWKHGDSLLAKGFFFGGAFTQGRSVGGLSVRGLTESRSFTFFTPDTINGKYIRANGEMTWMLGPAAIRAEYDQTNQRRDSLGPDRQNLPAVVAKGYMSQVTYLLTGEQKPEAGVVIPTNDLFGDGSGKQGFGAFELKFRYANLQIADGTSKSNRAESFYFGSNWYLNRFVRYMLDLGVERFKDPMRSPKPGDRNFVVVLSRVQVAF